MEDTYTIRVGDGQAFEYTQNHLATLDLVRSGRDRFHLLYKGKGHHIQVLASDFLAGRYTLEVDGREYEAQIQTPLDALIQRMGFAHQGAPEPDDIIAPMPGLLLEIPVREGQAVEAGAPLLVLEAMKMENIITSPRGGTIKKIHVHKGDSVDKNQLLLEFD